MNRLVYALEIGSGSVKLIAGYELNGKPQALDVQTVAIPTLLHFGKITDPALVGNTIKKVVRQAEMNLNVKIDQLHVIVPPIGFEIADGNKRTNVVSQQGAITELDISNLHTLFKKDVFSKEHAQVTLVPNQYLIDGDQSFTTIPFGQRTTNIVMYADVHFIYKELFDQIGSIFNSIGLKVRRILVDAFTVSELLPQFIGDLPNGYVLVDHAANLTSVSLISDHRLNSALAFDIGGEQLTAIIANQFSIATEDAAKIKEYYGYETRKSHLEYVVFRGKTTADSAVSITQAQLNETIYNFYKLFFEELYKLLKNYGPADAFIDISDIPIYWIGGATQIKGFLALCQEFIRYTSSTLVQLKVIGARPSGYYPALGAIRVDAKYPIFNDEKVKPVPTIERDVKTAKGKINVYEDDL